MSLRAVSACAALALLCACKSDGRLRRVSQARAKAPSATPAGDDRVDVSPLGSAVVRFGKCTATHVGRGYFLTAGHCVNETRGFQGHRSSPCPHPLTWDGAEPAACEVAVYRYDTAHDYALLRLSDPSTAEGMAYAPIDYQFDWTLGEPHPLVVIGYSKGTLQLDRSCSGKMGNNDLVVHDCTTEPGDSGSALIDARTGLVIGVHGGSLSGATNYASPVSVIPWADSLCVAVTSSEPIPVSPAAPPARFRVSTTHTPGEFSRVCVWLQGELPNRALDIRIFSPATEQALDAEDVMWKDGKGFVWRQMYVLEEDATAEPGPWSVEVSCEEPVSKSKSTEGKGYVKGKVWVCP